MSTSLLTRTQVYLDKQYLNEAKKLAKINSTTVSNIMRQALAEYINTSKKSKIKPKITITPLQDQTIRNYSERIDEIYD